MREFNAKQLKLHLEKKTSFLLDVRQPWEYDICHLENSILIPMAQSNTTRMTDILIYMPTSSRCNVVQKTI